jgi:hypothetical protein
MIGAAWSARWKTAALTEPTVAVVEGIRDTSINEKL